MKRFSKALLIDDDPITNVLNSRLIEKSELADNVVVVQNGQEALDYLLQLSSEEMPDLILLDVHMPVMNGFEFLDAYEKRFAHLENCVILMMLTDQADQVRSKAKDYKIVAQFIDKPLNREKVDEIKVNYL